MSLACHLMIADEVYLAVYLVTRPFPFIGMEEVNAQARNHLPSVTLFLPIEGKRIKIISLEIHHRINLIHNTFSHPSLRILVNGKESIPTTRRITRSIPVFANGAGTYFYPRFYCFYTFIYITYNLGNIIPAPLVERTSFAIFAEIIFIREKRCILWIT